ncbi:MAG: nucleotidyltransferase domain-containing protein [Leptolyngbya sp. SIOISBB]|nr:nucleotidyltransferase domain-containing protein [Leptolyngbya sp. SIOISBB]
MLTQHPAIPKEVAKEIIRRLQRVEQEHSVRVLYACESGSRAWGFWSPDSDFDVRFIYARKEEWYLSFDVERCRDVIEYPIIDEIDCGGWDIKKALYLFTRTNGALLEWLKSPIRYVEVGAFAKQLNALADSAANELALCYHYSHMARRNAGDRLDKDKIRLKKYFYILRPLLAIRYIEAGLGVPPIEFLRLVEAVAPDGLRQEIIALTNLKRQSPELGVGDQNPLLNAFIRGEFERHDEMFAGVGRPNLAKQPEVRARLNEIFREAVRA